LPSASNYFDHHWHLADGVGGAGQARVVRPHGSFDAVEHTFGDIRTMYIGFRDLVHSFAHRVIIMPRGDDQIGFADLTIGIDPIMVDQCSTRRFDHADALFARLLMGVEDIGTEDIRILE